MSFTSKGASEIIVAGWQDTMLVIDVIKGEIVKQVGASPGTPLRRLVHDLRIRQVTTEHHYTIMKKSKYICAATRTGCVDLLDPITFKVVRSWQAHASYINDMDAQNDFIVTCGGSLKQQAAQTYMLDPYVNVFDLKNMTSMKPMPFPPLAAYVRLHPRMLTTSIVTSQHGQMHVVDIMNPNTSNVRYANVMSFINLFEMAPSGEALAMVDTECNIHLWGSPSKIHFTDMALPIEMPKAEEPPPMLDWSPDTYVHYPMLPTLLLPADLSTDPSARSGCLITANSYSRHGLPISFPTLVRPLRSQIRRCWAPSSRPSGVCTAETHGARVVTKSRIRGQP